MQPLKLKMNAFGPYAGEETINFLELKNNKLFLISGPTGSGKTTIFDAMSYALYGEANGEQRSTDDLRSQFAGPDTLTRVSLEFSVKGMAYKILREPSQLREKKVGEGLTTHSAYAELKIYNKEPAEVITGIQEVTNKIIEIIGLDSQQFKQIMMIPQGEFRKLLVSDSQEREKILQKLFDTRIYKEIQEALKLKEKESRDVWEKLKTSQKEAMNRINNDLLDEKLNDILNRDNINIDELILRLKVLNKKDKETIDEIKKEIKTYEEESTILIEKKTRGIELNKQIDYLKNIKKEMKLLELKKEKTLAYKIELEKILAVKDIKPFKDMLNKVRNGIQKKSLVRAENKEALEKSTKKFTKIMEVYDLQNSSKQEKLREKLNEELIHYRSSLEKVKDLGSIKEKIALIKAQLKKNLEANEETNNSIEKIEGEILKSEEKIESLENALDIGEISEKLQAMNSQKIILKQVIDLKKEIDALDDKKNTLKKSLDNQEKIMLKKEEDYKKGKLLFHQNQAAILAKDLKEDAPCPVCGSYKHPKKAEFISGVIDQNTLESLEKANSIEKIRYETIKKDYLQLPDKIKIIDNKMEEGIHALKSYNQEFNLDQRSKILDVVMNTIDALEGKKVQVNKNKKEILKLKELITKNKEDLEIMIKGKKILEEAIHLKERELAGFKSKEESIESDIPRDMQSLEALKKTIKKLENKKKIKKEAFDKSIKEYNEEKVKIEKLNSIIEITNKDLKALKEEKVIEEEKFNKALTSKDMTEDEFNKYLEKIEKIGFYEKEIKEYDKEKNKLEHDFKRLEKDVGESSPVNIEFINERIIEITKKKEGILENKEIHSSRVKTNENELTVISNLKEELKLIEEEYKVLGDLSEVANGKNEHRMTFERYVLAAFLENIIHAANTRLTKMTSGRYEMSRTAKKERANKQSGLEIEVFDNYTGKERHVKTLSGGESFMASLAMALGLSDVVQSYAGSVRLDTMFIDEGFGTLDPDALDAAINCLIDLQDSGRLVGIISHVPELKERIEARLEVFTTNIGSTTEFIVL